MSSGEDKSRQSMADSGENQNPNQFQYYQHYGTFQGVQDYSQPAMGFPQPSAPPEFIATATGAGVGVPSYPPPRPPVLYPAAGHQYVTRGYQTAHGYLPVSQGILVRVPRLPCCGIGVGWFLFITGFFMAAIPWYIGAIILLCVRVDFREKPGLIACTIAATLAAIAVFFGVTRGTEIWD